jgi:hypothetical protein
MRRSILPAAVVAVACFAAPALAQATDFCVKDMQCTQAGGTDYPTLEDALAAAESGPSADRILIGTGTYTAPFQLGFSALQHPVQIIGSGAGRTGLTAPDGASIVLTLGNPSSSVSNLTLVVPAANDISTRPPSI